MATRQRLICSLILCFVAATAQAATLQPESLWKWTYIADPQIAPDGSKIAYVRIETDREKDRYKSDIWLLDTRTGLHKPFTTDPANDTTPRWSPDGSRLAFVSSRDGDKAQIYIIDMVGGEARQLTELEEGPGNIAWSPGGTRIAFTSRELTEEEKESEQDEKKHDKKTDREARGIEESGEIERATEAHIIYRLHYQSDGVPGFLDEKRQHIWVVPVDGGYPAEAKRITHGDFDDGAPAWTGDGKHIVFSAVRKPDADYELGDSEIYRVPSDGSAEPEPITARQGPDSNPMVSPDGQWIAYLGHDESDPLPSYAVTRLYIMRPDGSDKRVLTGGFDRDVASGASNDVASPVGGGDAIQWSADSEALYFTSATEGRAGLFRASLSGEAIDEITNHSAGEIHSFSLAPGGSIAAVYSNPTTPFELYTFSLSNPARETWTRRTQLNEPILAETETARYEEIWYESFDGMRIQGWIVKPPHFDSSRKWPLILYIHGGPHAMYGANFFHEFQVLAQSGYVVLITNPRGSTGYGEAFGNVIQYEYPGDDYKDLMAGVDVMLEKGYIDEGRMGVAGGSGGGLLTSWIIGRTHRFAAAVTQRSVINWYSFVGTSDYNYYFVKRWFRDFPWNDPAAYLDRSPISQAGNIQTPLLIIHSAQDYRTPLEQDQQLYTALKMQKKPVKMVVFPEESHGLSRGGRPSHRIERLEQIQAWFDHYLGLERPKKD